MLSSGAVQTCISSPVEMIKIRLQLQHALPGSPGYLGPWGMLRQITAQEGLKGERQTLRIPDASVVWWSLPQSAYMENDCSQISCQQIGFAALS